MPNINTNDYMSIKQVAELKNMTYEAVARRVQDGRIPALKICERFWLIHKKDAKKVINYKEARS